MRRLLLASLFLSLPAYSATLISDPDNTGVADKCVYQEGSGTPVEAVTVPIAPSTAKSCSFSLNSFSAGQHNLQVWFRSSLWGVDSAKVPFGFVKPAAGFSGPTGLTVVP